MEKKDVKVSNLYGRARRIELAEKVAYFIAGAIVVVVTIFIVTKQVNKEDLNVNFAYLRQYLETKGYVCGKIQENGGSCSLRSSNTSYTFTRYNDGFGYNVNNKNYILDIEHTKSDGDNITFKTYSEAFQGYRNKVYTCTYVKNIIGGLDKCTDEGGNELDLESYKGVITQAMNDLNNIFDSSGYYKSELINNYEWVKK